MKYIFTIIIGYLSFLSVAQTTGMRPDVSIRPETTATAIEIGPAIDGEVIGDELWQSIAPLTALIQTQPNAGDPVSEKTEIRLAYTPFTLYVSVVCYDTEPEKLVVSDSRRDAALANTDAFLFILDTYHDNQNGFVFGTNSIGIEYDAQVDNEGQGNNNANRQQGGVIGGFNLNWDGSWEVKTNVGSYGWSAEFAIPFKTLRFRAGENVTWGANFQRIIRKRNELAYWSPLPIQFDIKRLSLAGDITGLNLKNPGNLKVIPYLLGEASTDYLAIDPVVDPRFAAGADLKYSITPGLTLDMTYHTDFAQVEVDDQQVNLDRFNLFFPEKRPFFLENAGLFSIGSPGEIDLFFSRRIGLSEDGSRVPIIGGARVSGKIDKTNLGALSMFTEEITEKGISANNFNVIRVNHQLASRSTIGAAFVDREGRVDSAGNFNRTVAGDAKIGFGKKGQINGFFAKSFSPDVQGEDISYKVQALYEWNGLNANVGYTEVREDFNPEVGFLLRPGPYRKPEFLILKRLRPENRFGLMELRPHVSYRGYWDMDGFQVTGFLHVDNHWQWNKGFEIHTGINFTNEGLLQDFEISPNVIVPAGSYDHKEAQIVLMTNAARMLYFSTRSVIGGSFGGTRSANTITMGIRIGDKFNSEYALSRNNVHLPGGDFATNIVKSRLSYSFTPRLYIQSLVQYNSVVDLWSVNMRFGVLQQANTGLFIVYNELRDGMWAIQNRSFTLKYSRMFDIIK